MERINGIGKFGDVSTKPIKPAACKKITEEYVLKSAVSSQEAKVAVGLSTNEILLYDLVSAGMVLPLKGHTKPVTEIKFSQENPSILYTSSTDGNIFAWDIRGGLKPEQKYFDDTDGPLKPLLCFDFNANERYICAGTELIREDSFLIFWDLRTSKNLGGYWNSHTEEITHVQFHKECESGLASSSTDGLINIFDLSQCTEDDALINTLNTETSVNRFYWGTNGLSCVTGTEECQLWSTEDSIPALVMNRDQLSKISRCCVNYLIDVFGANNSLYLASGSNNGNVQLYSQKEKMQLTAFLEDGHCDVVRTLSLSKDLLLITGGEDGHLCIWNVKL